MASDETVKKNFKIMYETKVYNQEYVDNQNKLIELLENQIMDLTLMSKIELGDDAVEEIKRLKEIINWKGKEMSKEINITHPELLDIVSKASEIPQSTYSYLEDHTDGSELAIAEQFILDNISKKVLVQIQNKK